jgi:hypothetical protein
MAGKRRVNSSGFFMKPFFDFGEVLKKDNQN